MFLGPAGAAYVMKEQGGRAAVAREDTKRERSFSRQLMNDGQSLWAFLVASSQ